MVCKIFLLDLKLCNNCFYYMFICIHVCVCWPLFVSDSDSGYGMSNQSVEVLQSL